MNAASGTALPPSDFLEGDQRRGDGFANHIRVSLGFWPMPTEFVKSYPWRCEECLREQRVTPGFKVRWLATTHVRSDGSRVTVVWRQRHGGSRTALELFASSFSAMD